MIAAVPAHERPIPGPAAQAAARLAAAIPVLETDRLRLRAPRLDDFPAYAAILCGPRADTIGGPLTRRAAWDDFARLVAVWLLRGHGLYAAEPRTGGPLAGFFLIGFEPDDHEPELGWFLADGHEGRGLATEAALALRDHAFGALGLPSLVSYIDPANTRSARLAARLGALPDGTLGGCTVWRHAAPAHAPRTQERPR